MGQIFSGVHRWLNGTFDQSPDESPYNHWLPRHHLRAIRDRFTHGLTQYNVACFHVICDWLFHFNKWHLPADREEVAVQIYVKDDVIIEDELTVSDDDVAAYQALGWKWKGAMTKGRSVIEWKKKGERPKFPVDEEEGVEQTDPS